jgi:hypothetical protein
MLHLASSYSDQGRTAEAAALQEEVLEKQRRIVGAEHPNTLTSMLHLASSYSAQGQDGGGGSVARGGAGDSRSLERSIPTR